MTNRTGRNGTGNTAMLAMTLACAVIFVSSCTLGPDFERVFTLDNNQTPFINAKDTTINPDNTISQWWERIDDPILDDYVDQLLDENLALQAAGERVIQARESLGVTRGDLFPSISGSGSAGRSFSPGNTDRQYANNFDAGLDASWQIDLFGKIRKSVEAGEAQFQASLFDREALTHSLIADLVQRRVAIATNQRLLALAEENAGNRKTTLDVVQRRYDMGVRNTTATDVFLAEENYTTTRADIPRFERDLRDEAYRIDVLLGQTPGTTDPASSEFPLLPAPLDIATCLPADLLDRRPDLRASELRIAAANANIGVAMADLYPSLNIAGSLGFTSDETSNLFTADQLAGSILSSITARLFEGGSLRANIRLRESEARELAANYSEDVLNAMREVESGLLAERTLDQEVRELQASTDSLIKAEETAQERYILGLITLNQFLDTQQRRYTTEQNLIRKINERWNARIALYLALGGDWFNADNNACQAQSTPTETLLEVEET